MEDSSEELIPDPIVWRDWFAVSSMTGWRWDRDPDLNFPKPLRIRGRKYRRKVELVEFQLRLAEEREAA